MSWHRRSIGRSAVRTDSSSRFEQPLQEYSAAAGRGFTWTLRQHTACETAALARHRCLVTRLLSQVSRPESGLPGGDRPHHQLGLCFEHYSELSR